MKDFWRSVGRTFKDKRTYACMAIYATPALYRMTTGDSTLPLIPYPDISQVPVWFDNIYEKILVKPFLPGFVGSIWMEKYDEIRGKVNPSYLRKLFGSFLAYAGFTSLQTAGNYGYDPTLAHGMDLWEDPHHYPANAALTLISPLVSKIKGFGKK